MPGHDSIIKGQMEYLAQQLEENHSMLEPIPLPKVTIAVPFYRAKAPEFELSMNRLMTSPDYQFMTLYHQSGCIHRARNYLWNRAEGDYLLFIDSDMEFRVSDLDALVAMDVDIASGVALNRFTGELNVYRNCGDPEPMRKEDLPVIPFTTGIVGACFLLIKTSFIQEYNERCLNVLGPPFDLLPKKRNEFGAQMMEDESFCWRMKAIGEAIWVNPWVRIGHKIEFIARP